MKPNAALLNREELAGQRLMVGFDGTTLNKDVKYLLDTLKVGGLILFSRNIDSMEQVKKLCSDAQQYAAENNLPPLFISVDQEGGQVARFRAPFTEWEGNPSITTKEAAHHFASVVAAELKKAGVNMNLAPVLDVVHDTHDSIMEKRAFLGDAGKVSQMGCAVIEKMQASGVMAVAKHFPGIGRTVLDSHFELPVLDIDLDTLWESDLIPFSEAGKINVTGLMLSHILYPRLDPLWQASLSPKIVKGIIRESMDFDGLVMTDDLDMKAIKHDIRTVTSQILKSDIDIVLICHKGPNIQKAYDQVLELQKKDSSLYRAGLKSVDRILSLKEKYLV